MKILAVVFLLMSTSLFGMIVITPEYVKFPQNLSNAKLLYSSRAGFFIELDYLLCNLSDRFVSPDLIGISTADLLIKVGLIWVTDYENMQFIISKPYPRSSEHEIFYGMEDLPVDVKQAIIRAMPDPKKLEVYYPEREKLGIRVIDEE